MRRIKWTKFKFKKGINKYDFSFLNSTSPYKKYQKKKNLSKNFKYFKKFNEDSVQYCLIIFLIFIFFFVVGSKVDFWIQEKWWDLKVICELSENSKYKLWIIYKNKNLKAEK